MSVIYNSDNSFEFKPNQPENTQKPTIFGQKHPAFVCRYAERFATISEHRGFKIKCRDPRCSLDCARNFSQKLGACLTERLRQVSENQEINIFRGNLTPNPGATADDIRKLRRNFLQRIGRFRKKFNRRIEIHATLHLVSPTSVHYDIVAWSDLPYETLRQVIRSAWTGDMQHLNTPCRLQSLRGVLDSTSNLPSDKLPRYSLAEILDESTIQTAANYAAKANRPIVEWRGLPIQRKSPGYLESTWATDGFWEEGGQDAIWESLVARWKESGDLDKDDRQVSKAEGYDRLKELLPPEPSEQYRRAVELSVESGLTVSDTRQFIDSVVRSAILQTMPREEASAQSVHVIAQRWALSPDRVSRLLNGVNNLRRDWQGWLWVEGESK